MSEEAGPPGRIRVLELIKALDPGGAESLLVARLAHANHARFDYRVGCLDPNRQEWLPRLLHDGIAQVPISSSSRADWRWVHALRQYLIEEQVDVVHSHSPLAAVGVRLAIRSMRVTRPICITTEHNERLNRATQTLDAATVRIDDLVIAVSEATSQAPVCRRAKRVEVIDHGIDLDRVTIGSTDREELRKEFGMRAPSVVTVANFRTQKGYDDLLAIAELVHSRDATVEFFAAGQGPLESWVRQQVSDRGMGSYFHVVGSLPDAARLTLAGDVFTLASRWEGRPVAVMEALAGGRPIVAFSVGGIPEMISDGVDGYLIPPRDIEFFARQLLEVLHKPERAAELGRQATATASRYDISMAGRRIEDLYEELVRTRTLKAR